MNKIKANIIKASAIPGHVLIKKIFSGIGKSFSKKNSATDEFTFGITGTAFEHDVNIRPFLDLLPDLDDLEKYKDEIFTYCEKLLSYKINLLGNENINTALGIDYPDFVKTKINPANRNRASEILQLLDSKTKVIDWNTDFISGYTWNLSKKSESLSYDNLNGVDVKIPWEFGRLQHLMPLAHAAILSNDTQYLQFLLNQIISFIATNPPGYGIQWKSTMDVAIRAINLIFIYAILKKYKIETGKKIDELIITSIFEHVNYIYTHLEWNDGLRGNHYLFNLGGIITGDIFLSNHGDRFNFALEQFRNEILYQFNKDGGNFEASLPYHYFTCELLFLCERLLKANSIEPANTPALTERLTQIKKFTLANLDGNNTFVQIGDNDSGFVLNLLPTDYLNNTPLNAERTIRHLHSFEFKRENAYNFHDTGIYIRNFDGIFLTFRCGNVGQKGKGGHAHNDALSICLKYEGIDFLVDPGTYTYLRYPDERNKFRSSSYHNTLTVAGKEQNLILTSSPDDLFWLIERANPKITKMSGNILSGFHTGYGRKTERILQFKDNTIAGTDKCEINVNKQIHFHLHPDVKVIESNGMLELINKNKKILLDTGGEKYQLQDYEYSPAYGIKKLP